MGVNGTFHPAVTPEEKLRERLNDPRTAASLNLILDKIALVAFSVVALDGFLRRGDEIVEAVAGGISDLNKSLPGITLGSTADTVKHVKDIFEVVIQLKDLLNSPEVTALLSSGVLSPQTVSVVGKAGAMFTQSYTEAVNTPTPPQKIGLFGLLRYLNDPEIQRSLNFLLTFARTFGKKLGN